MKYNKGFAPVLIAIIIAGALVIGGGAYYLGTKKNIENKEVVENPNVENQGDNNSLIQENKEVKKESDCLPTSTPWIKITSPSGGETYNFSDSINIKWESCNLSKETPITGELVDVMNLKEDISNSRSLFCEGSDNPEYYKSSYCLNNGLRTISLKTNIIPGTYKIKVSSSLKAPFVNDSSDGTFTILSDSKEVFKNQPGAIKEIKSYENNKWLLAVDMLSFNSNWIPGNDSTGEFFINQDEKWRNLIVSTNTKIYECGEGPDGNPTSPDVLVNTSNYINYIKDRMDKRKSEMIANEPVREKMTDLYTAYFDITGTNITAIYEQCLP